VASSKKVSIVRTLLTWWGDGIRHQGWKRTAETFFLEMKDFLRDSTPARHRQRYGDMDYDWEYRVDTTGATVSLRNRFLGVFHSAYQPTDEQAFREMIGGLGIDYSQFTFLDLGSGKGRTLLMAGDYGFASILGIELLPELHRVAVENIRKFRSHGGDTVMQSICADARYFEFPNQPTVLYLFHPFLEPVLKEVVSRLNKSLKEHPRPMIVVYHNAVLEHVLAEAPALKMVQRSEQYTIFVNTA
jgi:SAM-dependent methyltransferase